MELDRDLDKMDASALRAEVQRLRTAIREHRDASGHNLCWHHPEMWGLLPEKPQPEIAVPEWSDFMRGCVRYRTSLDQQAPNAPRSNEEFDG